LGHRTQASFTASSSLVVGSAEPTKTSKTATQTTKAPKTTKTTKTTARSRKAVRGSHATRRGALGRIATEEVRSGPPRRLEKVANGGIAATT
jgi:hypothetical protein